MTSFFCQSEGHRSEGKSIWEDTNLIEKRFQRTQIWVWRIDWTRIWEKDTDLRPYTDLILTDITLIWPH